MRILAIETSCDETAAAVLQQNHDEITVLSNVTVSSSDLHAKTGGIIPEMASREQIKAIVPTVIEALLNSEGKSSGPSLSENFKQAKEILDINIDSIAVTYGPGLIGSLLVGVETAKALSFSSNKTIKPVNHLLAHIYANFIDNKIEYPFVGLIVSGGHTDLVYFESSSKYKWLGGTRDDAAGEAIDKIGRILGLSYPAGPEMEKRAKRTKSQIKFHSPLLNSDDFDFSFSGLKSEAARFVAKKQLTERLIDNICGGIQDSIFQVLVKKTIRALKLYKCNTLAIGGGVSANAKLHDMFKKSIKSENPDVNILIPKKEYSTDNAAMIGAYALMCADNVEWSKIQANPELYFD